MGGVDPFGWDDLGCSAGAEVELPAVGGGVVAGFDDGVVVVAEEAQVRQRCHASGPPGDCVVGVAGVGRFVGNPSAITQYQNPPLTLPSGTKPPSTRPVSRRSYPQIVAYLLTSGHSRPDQRRALRECRQLSEQLLAIHRCKKTPSHF